MIFCSVAVLAGTYTPAEVHTDADGLFLDKVNKPITGEITETYENGKVLSKSDVQKGILLKKTVYFPNGQVQSETTDRLQRVYRRNNTLQQEVYFSGNDIILIKKYHSNGQTAQELPYKNGVIDGLVKIYDENGAVIEDRTYTLLTTIQEDSSGHGRIFKNVAKQGPAHIYLPNKNVMTESYEYGSLTSVTYADATGSALPIIWQDKKALLKNGENLNINDLCYDKGQPFSGLVMFSENYSLSDEETVFLTCEGGLVNGVVRHYRGGKYPRLYENIPYTAGKKNGTMQSYLYQDLRLSSEMPFVNDVANGMAREYLENGYLYTEKPYVQGQKNGICYIYQYGLDEQTNQVSYVGLLEVPYENDLPHGTAKVYDEWGVVSKQVSYQNGTEVATNAKSME